MGKGTACILGWLAFFTVIAVLQQHSLANADDSKEHESTWFPVGGYFKSEGNPDGRGATAMDAVANAAVDAATFASEHVGKIASGSKAAMANTFKGPDGAEVVDKAAK